MLIVGEDAVIIWSSTCRQVLLYETNHMRHVNNIRRILINTSYFQTEQCYS